MAFLSETGLSLVDILFLAVILIGLPLESLLTLKKSRAELASNAPGVRIKHYTHTIYLLWGITLPLLLFWIVEGRSWEELGFVVSSGWLPIAGWGLASLIAAFFLYQHIAVRRSDDVREQYRNGISQNETMANFMPQTEDERRVFSMMGVTAGITEEVIFRGFLIWALSAFMPLYAAAFAALLIFTVLHLYQGSNQLFGVFAMGAFITLIYLLSGSLWPAIALHIFVDVINNWTVWTARQTPAVRGSEAVDLC